MNGQATTAWISAGATVLAAVLAAVIPVVLKPYLRGRAQNQRRAEGASPPPTTGAPPVPAPERDAVQGQVRRQQTVIGLLVFVLTLLIVMALTNPSRDKHIDWLKERRPLDFLGAATPHYDYHNYVFFSTTTGGPHDDKAASLGYLAGIHEPFW